VTHDVPDSLAAWSERYLALAVTGVRCAAVTDKITLHLARFGTFFLQRYGHDRLSACVRRDVVAWQTALREQGLAPAVINNHLASLSAFTTWVQAQAPGHDRPRRGPCPINARGTRIARRSGRARAGAVS
jgi:hypothetical protein